MKAFSAELYFALVEKMTVFEGGRLIVCLLDGTDVECEMKQGFENAGWGCWKSTLAGLFCLLEWLRQQIENYWKGEVAQIAVIQKQIDAGVSQREMTAKERETEY